MQCLSLAVIDASFYEWILSTLHAYRFYFVNDAISALIARQASLSVGMTEAVAWHTDSLGHDTHFEQIIPKQALREMGLVIKGFILHSIRFIGVAQAHGKENAQTWGLKYSMHHKTFPPLA